MLAYVIILALIRPVTANAKGNLTIGLLVPWTGTWDIGRKSASAVSMALDYINYKTSILPNHHLKLIWKDSNCSGIAGSGATSVLISKGAKAIIGPGCSAACVNGGLVASYYQIPMISYSCASLSLSDKKLYYTFARTKPFARSSKSQTPKIFVRLIKKFNWKKVCIAETTSSSHAPLALETMKEFLRQNITILRIERFDSADFDPNYVARRIKEACRIIVFIAWSTDLGKVMVAGHRLGMWDGRFVIITIDLVILSRWKDEAWTAGADFDNIMTGVITVSSSRVDETTKKYNDFAKEVKRRMAMEPFNYTFTKDDAVDGTSTYMYDATLLYALALNKSLSKGNKVTDGLNLANSIYGMSFEGFTGTVRIDENGDRIPLYIWKNINKGNFKLMGEYDPYQQKVTAQYSDDYVFPGGYTTVPKDEPDCGFHNEKCVISESFMYLIYIGVPLIAFTVLASALFAYKRRKYEINVLKEGLAIKFDDILFKTGKGSSHRLSKTSFATLDSHSGIFSINGLAFYKGEPIFVKKLKYESKMNLTIDQVLTLEVLLELKKVKDLVHTNINPLIGISVHDQCIYILSHHCGKGSLQDVLQNDNMECDWMFRMSFASDISKGMLEIHKGPIGCHGNLTSSNCLVDGRWVCKISDFGYEAMERACGITKEKSYADMQWTAPEHLNQSSGPNKSKAGDVYSLGIILYEIWNRTDPYAESSFSDQEIINKVRQRTVPPFRPIFNDSVDAPSGYYQLITRCWDDFAANRPTFKEIYRQVKEMSPTTGKKYEEEALEVFQKYQCLKAKLEKAKLDIDLLQNYMKYHVIPRILELSDNLNNISLKSFIKYLSIHDDTFLPLPRMSIWNKWNIKAKVLLVLYPMRYCMLPRKESLVDHMLTLMEKYANNLEDLVADRTRKLEEEKLKTETLLYKMLPKSVANELKAGRPVLAESFDSVTIFFSDIVGFTRLASESSPLEIVGFLNDLYSLFDRVIEAYDVYKVETIGDAYMVVSGLPIRNENRHAGEIATMSLDLLRHVCNFTIKHKKNQRLQLRIGIHTGMCVAGVVGLKMPRYCLFGDTVNTASRMESNGHALKIHVSSECKAVLDSLGGYILEERGVIEMKGKDKTVTYFLIGKEGFHLDLHDQNLVTLPDHLMCI